MFGENLFKNKAQGQFTGQNYNFKSMIEVYTCVIKQHKKFNFMDGYKMCKKKLIPVLHI